MSQWSDTTVDDPEDMDVDVLRLKDDIQGDPDFLPDDDDWSDEDDLDSLAWEEGFSDECSLPLTPSGMSPM